MKKYFTIENCYIKHFFIGKKFAFGLDLRAYLNHENTIKMVVKDKNLVFEYSNKQDFEKFLCYFISKYPLTSKTDENGQTLIHKVAEKKFDRVCKMVVSNNPDVAKIQDNFGETFLHICAEKKLGDVCILALETNPELAAIKNNAGDTFVHKSAYVGKENVCVKAVQVRPSLIMEKNMLARTFLHCMRDKLAMIKCVEIYNQSQKENSEKQI